MAKIFEGSVENWDELVRQHTVSGAVLQSSQWVRVQEMRGNPCARVLDVDGNPSLWVALPIATGLWVWYCPKGPLVLPALFELDAITQLLQSIKHATVLRIEPQSVPPAAFFKHRRDISPSHTLVTAISHSDEELQKSFHEKTRYNIRVAQRHNVMVKKLRDTELEKYREQVIALFFETGSRHAIQPTPRADLEVLFSVCDVWIALHGDVVVATALCIPFGATVTYLHGASAYEHRALMAPYALHWEIMRDARETGFTHYDWWGIAPESAATHSLAGVTRFKFGFGGTAVSAPGTFDRGIDRIRYGLYTFVKKISKRS